MTAAQAQDVRVSFSIFFDELEPHGVWVRHPRYRYVWCPDVDVRWRPYTNGRWVYMADIGWYFDSDEPFAWAVYHYGRWYEDDDLGWCWVPGRNWAPAWVSWRRSDRFIGWAPLPPEEDGYQITITVREEEPEEDDWIFVPVVNFIDIDININIILAEEEPDLVRETEYVGPVIIQNNVVINNIIDIDYIEQQTNQEVTIVQANVVNNPQGTTDVDQDNTVNVFAPQLEEPTEEDAPAEAVEPEEAAQARPQADADSDSDAEAGAEAEAEAAVEPSETDDDAAAIECPEGQELVDGVCVPISAEGEAAVEGEAATEGETAVEGEAGAAANAQSGTSDEQQAAPPEGQDAAPAIECPEGQELIDGVCVPIAVESQSEAGAEAEADAAVDANAGEAAADTDASAEGEGEAAVEADNGAGDEPAEEVCPEGMIMHEGKCITLEEARELGIVE